MNLEKLYFYSNEEYLFRHKGRNAKTIDVHRRTAFLIKECRINHALTVEILYMFLAREVSVGLYVKTVFSRSEK